MKKNSKTLRRLLLLSTLMVAGAGVFLRYHVLQPLGIEQQGSIMALPFLLMTDKTLVYQIERNYDLMMNPPAVEPEVTEPIPTQATLPPETEAPTEPPTEAPTEAPTEPPYIELDDSWFDDALFIGDSRSVGLKDVARLGQADYFCAGSMSVFTVQEWYLSDLDFKDQNLQTVLESNTYGKVFIHLGLNECNSDPDLIMEQYRSLVDLVREKQPDAAIILQSVMSVTRGKASNPMFALENITRLNQRIEALAEEQSLKFIDTNSWIVDEEGYMLENLTGDGCHLYGTGYIEWSQKIKEDAGWLGIP